MRVKIAVLEWPKMARGVLVVEETPGRFGRFEMAKNGYFSVFERFFQFCAIFS